VCNCIDKRLKEKRAKGTKKKEYKEEMVLFEISCPHGCHIGHKIN